MNATVCMPWRPAPDRVAAHRRVMSFWRHFSYPIVQADSPPHEPFHIAKARNSAVRRAETETVIVADADTIPDIGAVAAAVELLENHPHTVVWPHTAYRHIPNRCTADADLMTAPIDRQYANSAGGLFVTTRTAYWALGGQDEKLEATWGYDDSCFRAAAATLAAVQRLPGVVYSFNHSVPGDRDLDNPNRSRYELYKFAHGRPDVMRQLLK